VANADAVKDNAINAAMAGLDMVFLIAGLHS
jgi:hypothetical protein